MCLSKSFKNFFVCVEAFKMPPYTKNEIFYKDISFDTTYIQYPTTYQLIGNLPVINLLQSCKVHGDL